MPSLSPHIIWFGVVLISVFILIKYNSLWIYLLFDNALRNERKTLPIKYELQKYFKLKKENQIDYSSKWRGWDGWYFSFFPDELDFPIEMIRGSMMTGLYGLDGVDNYDKLKRTHLSSFEAAEFLSLISSRMKVNGNVKMESGLMQEYIPKSTSLLLNIDKLQVEINKPDPDTKNLTSFSGYVNGRWPDYNFVFVDSRSNIKIDLHYEANDIVWWADIPNIFTYFATFGKYTGKIYYQSNDTNQDPANFRQVQQVSGNGSFEHGYARKPFNFDFLWYPVKLIKKIFKSFNPVLYNYQLFMCGDDMHGGFMYAKGFGIEFRNRGGFFLNGSYIKINRVRIEYLDEPPPELSKNSMSGKPIKFYKKWIVKAETDKGDLEYTAKREWPAAQITGNMLYYNYELNGSFDGQKLVGKGYGEYLHI